MGSSKIPGALHSLPLRLKRHRLPVLSRGLKTADHPVKRCLYKTSYLPLPAHHHSQHTGHDTAHGQHCKFGTQVVGQGRPVLQGQGPGKIDPHKVIFLCPQVGGG